MGIACQTKWEISVDFPNSPYRPSLNNLFEALCAYTVAGELQAPVSLNSVG